jgi:hypothetical protein
MSAPVKDYQMPADEQGLSDCIIVWGTRQIILNRSSLIRTALSALVDPVMLCLRRDQEQLCIALAL